ncbi:uncharacterized protein LY79DRAFT_564383 [Colletotrichum navitas]|uniref:Uncharacterized protein n=1 Tax=Colletotrichum navitas TaxID=681940 RepID=A0AAD8PSI6_9PEZI|nr:uncharacterized protein LY79DRAFT_564383 [Colletotrichum navitas]KAK1579390.1 hypothetical protein LY79DRAFT_564383 [Colletotrichum navitas]
MAASRRLWLQFSKPPAAEAALLPHVLESEPPASSCAACCRSSRSRFLLEPYSAGNTIIHFHPCSGHQAWDALSCRPSLRYIISTDTSPAQVGNSLALFNLPPGVSVRGEDRLACGGVTRIGSGALLLVIH